KFQSEQVEIPAVLKVDPQLEKDQIERLSQFKKKRDSKRARECLESLKNAAEKAENIVYPVVAAVENQATVGEIADVFRSVWEEYRES
ncbi:MAG TPA: methylmalonyl-CoA mutase family protein, partial [Planctomycetaceae bacterium]|nr:methylmalonyl-CoA mutase family protein [Planctomycetaceae bacterium]